jgi:hypothetical protein
MYMLNEKIQGNKTSITVPVFTYQFWEGSRKGLKRKSKQSRDFEEEPSKSRSKMTQKTLKKHSFLRQKCAKLCTNVQNCAGWAYLKYFPLNRPSPWETLFVHKICKMCTMCKNDTFSWTRNPWGPKNHQNDKKLTLKFNRIFQVLRFYYLSVCICQNGGHKNGIKFLNGKNSHFFVIFSVIFWYSHYLAKIETSKTLKNHQKITKNDINFINFIRIFHVHLSVVLII